MSLTTSINVWPNHIIWPGRLEQDHRKINWRLIQGLGFKNFESDKRTIAGIEIEQMIKKNQLINPKNSTFKFFNSLAI